MTLTCHDSANDAVQSLLQEMESKADDNGSRHISSIHDTDNIDLTWLELGNGFDKDNKNGHTLDNFTTIDNQLGEVFKKSSDGTLMMILTQDNFYRLKYLMSKKQRSRWESAAKKQQTAYTTPIIWTDEDEKDLISQSAHCIVGAMFLRLK